jgi:hypothetical protein
MPSSGSLATRFAALTSAIDATTLLPSLPRGSTPGGDRRNAVNRPSEGTKEVGHDVLKTGRAGADTSLALDERTFDHGDMVRGEGPGALGELAEQVRPVSLAGDQGLPLLGAFEPLVPGAGLRRGSTVGVDALPGVTGATSLALALAAGASQNGSWVAAVGLGSLGLVAAAELGVALERLVLVADPGRDRGGERTGWPSVVAALVDGFDVVLVGAEAGARLRAADARRLVARVRERGTVLVGVGAELPGERSPLRLTLAAASWSGLGEGWGHLRGRRVTVEASGRGGATRTRQAELWLPAPAGGVELVEPIAEPIPLHRTSTPGRAS